VASGPRAQVHRWIEVLAERLSALPRRRILTACLCEFTTSSLMLMVCPGWPGSGRGPWTGEFCLNVSARSSSGLMTMRRSACASCRSRTRRRSRPAFISISPAGLRIGNQRFERLLALGARRVDVGQTGAESWTVLADPEGKRVLRDPPEEITHRLTASTSRPAYPQDNGRPYRKAAKCEVKHGLRLPQCYGTRVDMRGHMPASLSRMISPIGEIVFKSRTQEFPITARFRACGIVTRGRPPAAAGALPADPPSFLPSRDAGALADADGDGVLARRPQSSRGWVVDERDAGSPQVVDQGRGLSGRRDPGAALRSAAQSMVITRVQDGQGSQAGKDLILTDVQVLRHSWMP